MHASITRNIHYSFCVRDETEGADGRQEDTMSCVTSEVMVES